MSNIRTTHVIYHLLLYVLRFPLESKAAGCTVKIDVIETSRSRGPTPEAGTLEISRELGPCFLMQQPKRVAISKDRGKASGFTPSPGVYLDLSTVSVVIGEFTPYRKLFDLEE